LIVKVILESSYANILKIILLLFSFSIFIDFMLHLQFTRVAGFLSIAGLSVIYNTKHKYLGSLAFILGALIRFEMAIFIALIMFPLFLLPTINLKEYITNKNFKIVMFTLFLSFALKACDYAYYYLDSDWRHYIEFNKYRGLVRDNINHYNKCIKIPEKEDYILFFKAEHINPDVISVNDLKTMYQSLKKCSLLKKIKNFPIRLLWDKTFLYLLLISVSITFLFFYQNKNQRFRLMLTTFGLVGLFFYISLDIRLVYRVIIPAIVANIFTLVFLNEKRVIEYLNLIGFLLILIYSIIIINPEKIQNLYQNNINQKRKFDHLSELINNYLQKNSNKKLVPFGGVYQLVDANPFHISSLYPTKKLFIGSWFANIPFNKNKFDSFKYYINGYGLLMNPKTNIPSLISASILMNYNVKVFPRTVLQEEDIAVVEFWTDTTKVNKSHSTDSIP
jgi:hypothetical protein